MLARQQHPSACVGSARHSCALLPCRTALPYVIAAGAGPKPSCKQQLGCRRLVLDHKGTACSAAASAVPEPPVCASSQHCRNVLLFYNNDKGGLSLAYVTGAVLAASQVAPGCACVGSAWVCVAQQLICLADLDMVCTAGAVPDSCAIHLLMLAGARPAAGGCAVR
jgi:hypothetical protein